MVDQGHAQFDQRVSRLAKKHEAISRGYTARMRSDGLIEVKPRRARLAVSPRAILVFAAGFFLFKAFLLAALGPESYASRLEQLENGTSVERAGAWVMQIEPVSAYVSAMIGPILR